ncbi:hypothetical protein HRG_013537 [Hirsutella rhossiliensis]
MSHLPRIPYTSLDGRCFPFPSNPLNPPLAYLSIFPGYPASGKTDSLANLTPPRRIAPTPASMNGLQPIATPALFCHLSQALTLFPPLLPYCHRIIVAAVIPVKALSTHGHGHSLKSDTDLNLPVLSEEDQELMREFYTALNDDKMHSCIRC